MNTMDALHPGALVIIGTWLLLYRLFRHTRFRSGAELFTRICCGASLAFMSPLMSWPRTPILCDLILMPVGVLLSTCHPVMMALLATGPLGLGIGATFWQTTRICRVAEAHLHPLLLTIVSLGFVVPFVCVPGIAGPTSLVVLVIPLLGALLVVVGMASFVPAAGSLTSGELLAVSCTSYHSTLLFLGMWFALAFCGVLMQVVMVKKDKKNPTDENGEPRDDLVASLLPNAQSSTGTGDAARQDLNRNDRFSMITKAIFAEEGADQSHLSEYERKLVEVCRKDEEERDRVLWGGGLY